MSMRIGFDGKRAFHTARGLGSYSRTVISYLAEFYPDDQFIVFTPSLRRPKLSQWHLAYKNIEIVTPTQWWAKIFPSLWRTFYLSKEIEKYHLDLYHGLSHELPWRIESTGVKTVVTIHDLIYVKFPHFFNFIDRYIFEKKFSSSIRRADRVIAICQQTKNDIVEHFKTSAEKIEVVYQSCHPRFFAEGMQEQYLNWRNELSLPDYYILYLGALVPNKNIELVIRALAMIPADKRPLFVVAGQRSSHYPKLVKLVEALDIGSSVKWLIAPDDKFLPALYDGAELFCFPSFYEGFGIPVIEALCQATPVLTSKQGALEEAAGPGGHFIDPTSVEQCLHGIVKILEDQHYADSLGQQGKAHVQKFNAKAVTQKLYSLYARLVSTVP